MSQIKIDGIAITIQDQKLVLSTDELRELRAIIDNVLDDRSYKIILPKLDPEQPDLMPKSVPVDSTGSNDFNWVGSGKSGIKVRYNGSY